jgi:hypothetical protein
MDGTFKIEFSMYNDDFRFEHDYPFAVNRVFQRIVESLFDTPDRKEGHIFDSNGNSIGTWSIEE